MAKHAKLSASGSKMWINCPGSIKAQEGLPRKPSGIFAKQGTAAHALADYCLSSGMDAEDCAGARVWVHDDKDEILIPSRVEEGGKLEARLESEGYTRFDVVDEAGNGETNQVVVWAVDMFVHQVKSELAKTNDNAEVFGDPEVAPRCEQYLDMGWLHPLLGGTADVNWLAHDDYVKLFDLKFGSGVTVDVEDNTQLKIYSLGILHQYEDKPLGVDMWIVQPRKAHKDGPVRHIRYTREELLEFRDELLVCAEATQAEDAPRSAGDHCLWCEAKHTCQEFRRKTQELARMDFANAPDHIEAPTDREDLARLAAWIPMLNALSAAVDGAIARELNQGREVEGWKLVRGKTNRKFGDPETGEPVPQDKIVKLLKTEGMLTDEEIYKPLEMRTLAQLEKFGKDAKEAIKKVTFKPVGALTVVPNTDTRERVMIEASFPDDEAMELPI